MYLCDDGRDPKKRKWVDALADPAIVYVSGRKRPAGETNGEGGGGGGEEGGEGEGEGAGDGDAGAPGGGGEMEGA